MGLPGCCTSSARPRCRRSTRLGLRTVTQSPSGRSHRPRPPEVWTVRPAGSGVQQLTVPGTSADFAPVYSPQGDKIAFERHTANDTSEALVTMNAAAPASPLSKPRSARTGDRPAHSWFSIQQGSARACNRPDLTLSRSRSLIGQGENASQPQHVRIHRSRRTRAA
jgi:hypothetical protein